MRQPAGFSPDKELWNPDPQLEPGGKGLYVAISGNTGAGKSSLIKALMRMGESKGNPFLCVSERALHHPYLPLMFARPGEFAFPIQLNFMLQRYMVLSRHLGLGRTVVIERSHLDDIMFVEEHAREGRIGGAELEAYRQLAKVLQSRLPPPDLMVLMDVDPETSFERVTMSEREGSRPLEFPDDSAKKAWVERWHGHYRELHADFRREAAPGGRLEKTRLIEFSAVTTTSELAENVYDLIHEIALGRDV